MTFDTFGITAPESIIDLNIFFFDPAETLQSVLQSRSAGCRYRNILACDEQNADAPYSALLLRARCERPTGRRTAKKGDEFAPRM
jgi:hypothetical protein